MESKINIRLRLLSYAVIAYMLMAFSWWTILLYTKNKDAFRAKRELEKIGLVAEGLISTEAEFYASDRYKDLLARYQRQEWMILGEAAVFVVSLVIGVYLINRSYNKEMMAALQRRNFLLSITHELKSPIASIQLVLETFLRRDLPKEKADRLTQNALTETNRLNKLVNDLLLSAKLETAYQPHLEPLDIVSLIEELIPPLSQKNPQAHISVHVQNHIPTITGDKTGLTSVALNLLENAIKYSPKEAYIKVEIDHIAEDIQIKFMDEGIGISEKEKKRIFEKFYRVGSEDTRKTKGTGLGLYIVNQIVIAHGGKIEVQNNSPRGTVFSITLPTSPIV